MERVWADSLGVALHCDGLRVGGGDAVGGSGCGSPQALSGIVAGRAQRSVVCVPSVKGLNAK